jgi:predicted DNA-binding transcriptional regulator YafY
VSDPPRIQVLRTEPRKDGSVVVHGETEDVFWAVRALLHYGPNCQVLGGERMRAEMVRVVREMAKVYEDEG